MGIFHLPTDNAAAVLTASLLREKRVQEHHFVPAAGENGAAVPEGQRGGNKIYCPFSLAIPTQTRGYGYTGFLAPSQWARPAGEAEHRFGLRAPSRKDGLCLEIKRCRGNQGKALTREIKGSRVLLSRATNGMFFHPTPRQGDREGAGRGCGESLRSRRVE